MSHLMKQMAALEVLLESVEHRGQERPKQYIVKRIPLLPASRRWSTSQMLLYFLLLVAAAACHAAPAAVLHSTALFHPDSASMNSPCPHTYTVLFQTTKGNFEVQVEQAWAPNGAQRFYNLVKNGEQGCSCSC